MASWIYLVVAILMEVSGTTCMKLSDGFQKPIPSILLFVFYGLSFGALAMTLKKMEVGVAYAVWSGLGTALIAMIGILWFGEAATWLKAVSLLLIIVGVAGLNMGGGLH
ncbi:MAG: multidrug efflux SMR transporter [Nitrospinae bacterium]|nr:multidrug efflux SMR transporter [Nitrospinota bacterium]